MKKRNEWILVIIGVLLGFVIAFLGFDIKTQVQDATLKEKGFYPARDEDKSDDIFAFDTYLRSINASEVKRFIYHDGTNKIYELHFKLGNQKWTMRTTKWHSIDTDESGDTVGNCGQYSDLSVEIDGVIYTIPQTDTGFVVDDYTSPFSVDTAIFDIFHVITSGNAKLYQQGDFDKESPCPFKGLGIAHYEQTGSSDIIWHDDVGTCDVDRKGLHF